MKVKGLYPHTDDDQYTQKTVDEELSRKRDKLVRKYKDKKNTKDRKQKRKQKTRGYYV